MLPFIVRRPDGTVVGGTTYLQCRGRGPAAGDRLHLDGGVARSGTGVNAESKLLLLTHAFDVLGCLAVEFRTHWHNQQSRAAIARLGAKQDGVLRNHRRMPDGSLRDTVVFSILDTEWPAVRSGLRAPARPPLRRPGQIRLELGAQPAQVPKSSTWWRTSTKPCEAAT